MTKAYLTAAVFCVFAVSGAEFPKAPADLPPDPRFKTDILLIVAHPDDETAVSGYLAKAIFDEHRRVSVIFGTRGNGGGNAPYLGLQIRSIILSLMLSRANARRAYTAR
jgi:hypothetical protein